MRALSVGPNDSTIEHSAAKIAGVTRNKVREFLAGQFAYTLHRPARRRFKRNPIYASGIDRQWQADLADMQTMADENDRARYMLTVVDVSVSTRGRCRS